MSRITYHRDTRFGIERLKLLTGKFYRPWCACGPQPVVYLYTGVGLVALNNGVIYAPDHHGGYVEVDVEIRVGSDA